MTEYLYISKTMLQKLKDELNEMKTVKRPELSQKISTARDFGDLKENAEYHAAKEELGMLESRISLMESKISLARIIDLKNISTDKAAIYTTVSLKDLTRKIEVKFSLVSPEESDFSKYRISYSSPVGKALLGKEVGDKVEVKVPAGIMKYEVLKIEAYEE
ncbi:MAG: transcription elongation factor GreA [Calditrichia bacterium]